MSKINREQFEAWGMSDTDLRITLECETYAGIAWLAWQAATNEAEAQLTALTSQLESVVAENAALKSSILNTQGAIELACAAVNDDRRGDVFRDILNAIYVKTASETPATEAFLAEVRASGVEMFAEHLSGMNISASETSVREFAAQLRQGGAV